MSSSTCFATADYFTGQYKDRAAFIAGILGRLQVAARQDGWTGTAIYDADWIEADGHPDMAAIALRSGQGDVSVADVRQFLIDKKRNAKKQERATA